MQTTRLFSGIVICTEFPSWELMRSHDHCGVQLLSYSTVLCNFLNKNIWGSGENRSSCVTSIQSTLKKMKQLGSSVLLEVLALLGCYAALVGGYWRFGTVCRSHLQGSGSPRNLLRLPATTYQPTLHNIPEERRPQQHRGGSLIPRSILPSQTLRLSHIGEKASAIRSIDLHAGLKTNLWYIFGRVSSSIYFLHLLTYLLYLLTYLLHGAGSFLRS